MVKVEGSVAETEMVDLGSSGLRVMVGRSDITDAKPLEVSGTKRLCGPSKRASKGKWTQEEDEALEKAVHLYQGKNWKRIVAFGPVKLGSSCVGVILTIAACVPGRTDMQCMHRWQKVIDPRLVKGWWTQKEDDLVVELVQKKGIKKWSEVANHLKGRIGKQCRERYNNHLAPGIRKCAWTKEEQTILINAHASYGNRWAEIAKLLPGRSENMIKNHWNCTLKKKPTEALSIRHSPKQTLDLNQVPTGYSEAGAITSPLDQSCNSISINAPDDIDASHKVYPGLYYEPPPDAISLSDSKIHMKEIIEMLRLLNESMSSVASCEKAPSVFLDHSKVEEFDSTKSMGKNF